MVFFKLAVCLVVAVCCGNSVDSFSGKILSKRSLGDRAPDLGPRYSSRYHGSHISQHEEPRIHHEFVGLQRRLERFGQNSPSTTTVSEEPTTTTTTEAHTKEGSPIITSPFVSLNKKEFVFIDEELPWSEARDACIEKGMRLASPKNGFEILDLKVYLGEENLVPKDEYSGYWVGGYRTSADNRFVWTSSGEPVGVYGWLPGEPNGFTGENCIEQKKAGDGMETNYLYSLGWNNYYCTALKRYICERIVPHEYLKNEREYYSNSFLNAEQSKMTPSNSLSDEIIDLNKTEEPKDATTEETSSFDHIFYYGRIESKMPPSNSLSDEIMDLNKTEEPKDAATEEASSFDHILYYGRIESKMPPSNSLSDEVMDLNKTEEPNDATPEETASIDHISYDDTTYDDNYVDYY